MNKYLIIASWVGLGAIAGWGVAELAGHEGHQGAEVHKGEESHEGHAKEPDGHDDHAGETGHEEHAAQKNGHDDHAKETDEHAGEAEGGHEGHDEHAGEGSEPGVIPDSLLAGAGISLDTVRAGDVARELVLPGRIQHDPSRVFTAASRFPGVLKDWSLQVGDRVSAGQVVARIESDASLEVYEIKAARAGTLVHREARPGQAVQAGQALGEFAETGSLVVDLQAGPSEVSRVRAGMAVEIRAERDAAPVSVRIDRILPSVDRATQTRVVRAKLADAKGRFAEGLFVKGSVQLESVKAPQTIDKRGVQYRDGSAVVFVRADGKFVERAVTTGRSGSDRIEILTGLRSGDIVAGRGSFVVKADLGKGEAGHDH